MTIIISPVHGQAAELTLAQAVDKAIAHNPGLQAAQFQTLSAREKMIQARSGALPQVYLQEQVNRTTNPMWAFGTKLNQESIAAADFDPNRLNDPNAITNYSTMVAVNWPVYDSGQTWYGVQQAGLNQEAAALSQERTRQQVIAGTVTAYIRALLVRENQAVIQQILETARTHLKLVQSRYNGGFVAKSDLLRAQVHIADLEQQFSESKSQTDIAKCMLKIAMGGAGNLDDTLTTPLEAGLAMTGTLDEWISKALAHRPDFKQLKFQKQIADKERDKARASRLPSVSLSGNYEINSEDFNDSGTNYTVGAVASLPLFTGGRISSRIRDAEFNLKQSNAMLQGMEQRICGETRQAFFTARSAWERIQVATAAIGQSKESLRIVKNRYNSGLFTITDLLNAEVIVQQSLTNHLKAIHDYRAAMTRLELAAGILEIK
ncbi:TolC family protein [Desulfocicer niacini]